MPLRVEVVRDDAHAEARAIAVTLDLILVVPHADARRTRLLPQLLPQPRVVVGDEDGLLISKVDRELLVRHAVPPRYLLGRGAHHPRARRTGWRANALRVGLPLSVDKGGRDAPGVGCATPGVRGMTPAASLSRYRRRIPGRHHGDMTAHAHDRQLFERFCMLRDLYRRRGPRDRAGIMSIEDAIRYAELLLARSAASTV